ncbi:hypothetical protein BDZ91DRAFT_528540 [Kalaharituber pfeilii]|nr:hypothetical protein BDZ91DRAFT_528540 [Kalaharituber pfeilii]
MQRYKWLRKRLKKQLRIRDTDSMHGTYVNGKPVWGQDWKTIMTGDTITFGTQVNRDGETFMPKDFTCDIVWEKIEPAEPEPSVTKPERRMSGYGVSSEDLIISDDDTESLDYDKADDTDTIQIPTEFPTSSVRVEEPRYGSEVKKNQAPSFEGKTEAMQHVHAEKRSLLSPVVAPTPPLNKFSIGSLMNDTLEAQGLKSRSADEKSEMEKSDKVEEREQETAPESAVEPKENLQESKVDKVDLECTESVEKPNSSNRASTHTIILDSDSDSDEPPEELNSKGGLWSFPKPSTIDAQGMKPPFEKSRDGNEAIKKPPQADTSASTTSTINPQNVPKGEIDERFAHLVEAAKRIGAEKRRSGLEFMNSYPEASGYSKSSNHPEKEAFFTAMKENQARFGPRLRQEIWSHEMPSQDLPKISQISSIRTNQSTCIPQPPVTHHVHGGESQTVPLPWVKCFAPPNNSISATLSTEASGSSITQEANMKSQNAENCTNQAVIETTRKPHIFEQILSSDEAKARSAKLEKLKAVVYNHRNKQDVTLYPWSVVEEEEFSYFEGEDTEMELDENRETVFANNASPIRKCVYRCVVDDGEAQVAKADDAKPRGFSISNLVHEPPAVNCNLVNSFPDGGKWIAEKVQKTVNEHTEDIKMGFAPSPDAFNTMNPNGTEYNTPSISSPSRKRKLDELSEEDKIVQEPTIEEKIEISGEPTPSSKAGMNDDIVMKEVSEEKEIYQETMSSPAESTANTNPVPVEAPTTTAYVQQPPVKRARLFTTGFALGAVTGAVGVFAALVASAP